MASRFRRFLSSILYAGLTPNAPRKEPKRGTLLDRLKERLEKFLAGRAPDDPLYLSRRTPAQKVKMALVIAGPCVLLCGALALAMTNLIPRTPPPPAHETTPAEIVAKLLHDLEKTVKIETNRDAELVEVSVQRGDAPKIAGLLRNRTDRPVSVEFELELTDEAGSRIGAVVGRVDNAPAKNTIPFQLPIKQRNAAFAVVRDLRTLR